MASIWEDLVGLARLRLPEQAANFVAADAWNWEPGRAWDFVYSLLDLAPDGLTSVWLERLAGWVTPGGRLIIGSYGSRSRRTSPVDVASVLSNCGHSVAGAATGGDPPITSFAWADL